MNPPSSSSGKSNPKIALPAPKLESDRSLESALAGRRSIREFTKNPLSLQDVSQLLWATQGITAPGGERTAPSAGALYPLEIYVATGMTSLDPAVYHYRPHSHEIVMHTDGDKRASLARASLKQECVRDCAAVFVYAVIYERVTKEYGKDGDMYVHFEVGHATQNTCLQATALGLGSVPVGAFDGAAVERLLELPPNERALYLLPVGNVK